MESVSGKTFTIANVYAESNQANLMKPASDPLWRTGVKGNCLYMDGVSNYIEDADFKNISTDELTVSAWVAPRVFENNFKPEGLTCIVGKGDVGLQEGWLLGYGYLGTWGLKVALENNETGEIFTAAFYDPVNYLPLYEWSHVAASYNAKTGRVCLYLNGELVYEQIYNEYAGCDIVASSDPLRVGKYIDPATVYGIDCNLVAGLLDEVCIYDRQISHAEAKALYEDKDTAGHPACDYADVMLDPSVYEGDRYRPQYHAIPPGMWMNEPHAAFYYKGYYHLFYQSNPNGPYWAQIRWSHWVSTDMVHWEYVKEAVVPTKGICPDGVWTGGAVIGPDGTPWRIGVRDPFSEGNLGVLEVEDCAVVTSGGYQNYFTGEDGQVYWHILDPDTGYPARTGLASVTVVAPEGVRCDALSTALFVMGADDALDYWREAGDFDLILVTEEREVYITLRLENAFSLNGDGFTLEVVEP